MASSHRISTQTASDILRDAAAVAETAIAADPSAAKPEADWASDDDALLGEMLREHGFPAKLTQRLVGLAAAPAHIKRPVDRLALALGAQFNFLALEEGWQMPLLLCG
ncbi:MAG TPA: hypothetical protein VKV32_01545, partial [Stellaceae bacterium]|nr:hypothetical protein [Stellaceae bacterium]